MEKLTFKDFAFVIICTFFALLWLTERTEHITDNEANQQWIDLIDKDNELKRLKIDSLEKTIFVSQVIIDSLEVTYQRDSVKINNVKNYYNEKIHSIDSLPLDSIRKLLSGHNLR